jgi:hypothetical protein
MKSKTLLTVALSLSAFAGFSQATEVQTKMGKETGTALRIEIDEPSSKVEKAIQTQLTQTGVKPTKMKKGQYQYKNVKLSPTMNDSINVYTKVEAKGKDKSIVYLAAVRPDGSFITEESDKAAADQIKSYLYDFVGTNNLTSIDYDIYQVSDSIKMDESSAMKYDEEKKKLQKQQEDINKQLSTMETTYTQSKADADRRKQRLQELEARKGTTGAPVSSTGSKPSEDASKKQ